MEHMKIAGYSVVAPLVGAWIEIDCCLAFSALDIVAPLVGAWIEMCVLSR